MDVNQLLDGLGVTKPTVAASFFGALLSLRWIDRSLTRIIKLSMLLGGFAAANYGAPMLTEFMAMKGNFTPGLAFFLGLFGMSLIDAVYTLFRDGTVLALLKGRLQK